MEKGMERRRVVLVPPPYQGHITPMLQLATALHSMGFSITIVHVKYNSPNPSNYPDFDFLRISDKLPKSDSMMDVWDFVKDVRVNCGAIFQEILCRMMENQEPCDHVAAIIYDTLMYFPEAVANHLRIPSLVLYCTSASYMELFSAVPRLKEKGYFPLQESMLQEPVPELHPLKFIDLHSNTSTELEVTLKVFELIRNIRNSSAIIWNTVDFLEHSTLSKLEQHYKVPIFAVGPLHKMCLPVSTSLLEEDSSCLAWLDNQAPKSVIYVSRGSLVTMDEKELEETAWGLANCGQPFLWVVRPGSVQGSEWIELLPKGFAEEIEERGRIVKWAPQKKVLAHGAVGGFWSHCGWNSTLESIWEGVPMICRPSLIEQRINARYLSYVWNLGLELEGVLERGKIEKTIRRLMVDKREEISQRMIHTKEKVEACISEGGTSYNSFNDLAQFILSRQSEK